MFERKSAEQLVTTMINWTKGVTTKLTDFRSGSKILTIYQAVALIVEELYDKVFRSLRELIEENIYAVLGFDKIPATYATANDITFARAEASETNYLIPAGTIILSKASEFKAPVKYQTVTDAVLSAGALSVQVPVICMDYGIIGNADPNTITDFLQKPVGIETVTNPTAIVNGREEETVEEQKNRLFKFIKAQARGVLQSVEYGAETVKLIDSVTGGITEQVIQARAEEVLPARKGEVDLYVWNGVGSASQALKDEVTKVVKGYYDIYGEPIYGYKPAGILLNVYSATPNYVKIKITLTIEAWADLATVKSLIGIEVDSYFAGMKLGQTLINSDLQARLKYVEGVLDIKVEFSTDNGVTYNTNNVTTVSTGIVQVTKPLTFV